MALASSIPVLDFESVCPRKGCPWPWHRIFLCPWPRALCSRLRLWPKIRTFQSRTIALLLDQQASFNSTKTCISYKYCNKFEISLKTKLSYKGLFEEHTQTLGKSCYIFSGAVKYELSPFFRKLCDSCVSAHALSFSPT